MPKINDTVTTLKQDSKTDSVTLPTTFLSQEEATVLAHYRAFLDAHELMENIYCDECAGPPSKGAKIARGDIQLAVFCSHRVWFFQGALPLASKLDITPEAIVAPNAKIMLTDAVSEDSGHVEQLGESDAKLLRAYREILVRQGWKEALDCRTCWAAGTPEGCRAFITPDRIAIICRHRTLSYVGQTT